MLDRRTMIGGALAAAATAPVHASESRRLFDLYRGRSRIGEQEIRVIRRGNEVEVDIDCDIVVKMLGMSVYRYDIESREIWRRGSLVTLAARTNDNGTAHRVQAQQSSGGIQVQGTRFSGVVPRQPATTTYWAQEFLTRPVWISTQDGTPMNVSVSRAGSTIVQAATGPISATKFACRGDIGRLDLFYDARGEWVGSEFDARGETARFVLRSRGGEMAPLWVSA